jgi:7-cyano-7-deazaguanine reductase
MQSTTRRRGGSMDEKKFRKKLKKAIKSAKTVTTGMVEIVDYEYHEKRDISIVIEHREFTSLCPRSGLPDFGTITIRYIPQEMIIELRSLKFYLLQYRNVGIFYEHVVNRILDDLVALVEPLTMEVTGAFNSRGGITTTAKAVYASKCNGAKEIQRTEGEGPDPRD